MNRRFSCIVLGLIALSGLGALLLLVDTRFMFLQILQFTTEVSTTREFDKENVTFGTISNQYKVFTTDESTLREFDKENVTTGAIRNQYKVFTTDKSTQKKIDKIDYKQTCKPVSVPKQRKILFSLKDEPTPNFLPEFKNPCWRTVLSQAERNALRKKNTSDPGIRCLPYAYLAGFPKCGSTDLFFRVIGHPSIPSYIIKESQYMNTKMYHSKCHGYNRQENVSCSVQEYADKSFGDVVPFVKSLVKPDARQAENVTHPGILVDSSVDTLWFNSQWKHFAENVNCSEPYVMNADIITKINPGVKFVVILRNPVARTYSDYFWFSEKVNEFRKTKPWSLIAKNEHPTPAGFHAGVVRYLEWFKKCVRDNGSDRYCVYEAQQMNVLPTWGVRMHPSFYHTFLADLLERLSRDRLLALHAESYYSDIAGHLKKVFDFLDLEPLDDKKMENIARMTPSNVSKNKTSPMWNTTKQLLEDFFRPQTQRLAKLLGDDRFTWNL